MTSPKPLPLTVREAAWRRLWAALLAPADRAAPPPPDPAPDPGDDQEPEAA